MQTLSIQALLAILGLGLFLLGGNHHSIAAGQASMSQHPGLVDSKKLVSRLYVDLKYATTDNFLKRNVYGDLKQCYLQQDAAQMLAKADKSLQAIDKNLHLIAYDCARPRRVQRQMWDVVKGTPQQGYVANPNRRVGSIHNYGCAIDLGLAQADGTALDMGTAFDFFGDLAQPRKEIGYYGKGKLNAKQLGNRLLLRYVMVSAGFIPISNEWWHFNCATPSETRIRYPIIE